MTELSPEIDGKMRQYKRVLLSYADFKHAKLVSSYILDERVPEKGHYILHEALNCSMVVAYCRPFSGNNSSVPDLPNRLLRTLDPVEREIHEIVMADRNTVLAHSDADVLNVEPVRWQPHGCEEMVLPIKNWGLAPLTEEATVVFNSAAQKLFIAIMEERNRMEPELIPYMRLADAKNPFNLIL